MRIMLRAGFLLASFTASVAGAQTQYQCASGDQIRRVEIVYESQAPVPCEVHYIKETEDPGSREVLWNARNESGYCEARTQEFIQRLQSLGWSCTAGEAAPEVDDSDVLAPAGEQD